MPHNQWSTTGRTRAKAIESWKEKGNIARDDVLKRQITDSGSRFVCFRRGVRKENESTKEIKTHEGESQHLPETGKLTDEVSCRPHQELCERQSVERAHPQPRLVLSPFGPWHPVAHCRLDSFTTPLKS